MQQLLDGIVKLWESFQDFSGDNVSIIAFVISLTALIIALSLINRKSISAKALSYSAICIALGTLLHLIQPLKMPQGGSISACSMLFVALPAYFFGLRTGVLAAVSFGFLQLAIGPYAIHPIQLLLDYPIAFGMFGLAGLTCNRKYGLYTGYVIGCVFRFLAHFISGCIFFADYAGLDRSASTFFDYWKGVAWYSAAYNGSYIFAEMAITLIILAVPSFAAAIAVVKRRAREV